jgi:hypothetical protein
MQAFRLAHTLGVMQHAHCALGINSASVAVMLWSRLRAIVYVSTCLLVVLWQLLVVLYLMIYKRLLGVLRCCGGCFLCIHNQHVVIFHCFIGIYRHCCTRCRMYSCLLLLRLHLIQSRLSCTHFLAVLLLHVDFRLLQLYAHLGIGELSFSQLSCEGSHLVLEGSDLVLVLLFS